MIVPWLIVADKLFTTVFPLYKGGFSTDKPPQTRDMEYLSAAENVMYEASQSVRKVGGTAKVNGSTIGSTISIVGMVDYWAAGTGGTFTQQLVVLGDDNKLYADQTSNQSGTMTNITGSATISSGAVPIICTARDSLIIATDKYDPLLTYTGSGNVSLLGGSPPAGRAVVYHVNRPWVLGSRTNPSRLTYGSSTAINDFTGADTGSIDIDPEDGDILIGGISYKNNLIVFKGPNVGSIHVISGRTPATFARDVLVRGIALQTHNSIVNVGDDIWYMSNRGCHSLASTQKFGNFEGTDLTKWLKSYFQAGINRTRLDKVWGVHYRHKGCVIWALSPSGSSTNTQAFGISYVNVEQEGFRPFVINRACQSAAIRINPSNKVQELIFGDNTGFIRRQDLLDRSIDGGTGYNFRILSPAITLGIYDAQGRPRQGDQPVGIQRIYLRSRPTGDYNVNINVTRDGLAPETYSFHQGTQGFILGTSVLGTGRLGGGTIQTTAKRAVGLARTVRLELTTTANQLDAELYEVGIDWLPIAAMDQANIETGTDTGT